MRTITALGALIATFGIVHSAFAQTPGRSDRPPPEVGFSVGKLGPPVYGDFATQDIKEPTFDVRVTAPFSDRFAFEAAAMIGRRSTEFFSRTEGLYFLQIKQRLRSAERGAFRPFLLYGLSGYYSHLNQRVVDIVQPDGSVVHLPPERHTNIDAPAATTIGGGFQLQLSKHIALRTEAQLATLLYIPLGFRVATGVSIPLGRYSTN